LPKYLIRRRNRFGQWEHIETMEYEPTRESIKSRYGPGEYNIMLAEENIRGLQNFANYSIPYSIDYVAWTSDKPNAEFIAQNYGIGSYFVIGQASDISHVIVPSSVQQQSNGQKIIEDIMVQGAPVMRRVYIIFRLTDLPYY